MSKIRILTILQMLARLALAICLSVIGCPVFAAELVDAATCVAISGSGERLKCYYALGGRINAKNAEDHSYSSARVLGLHL